MTEGFHVTFCTTCRNRATYCWNNNNAHPWMVATEEELRQFHSDIRYGTCPDCEAERRERE